NVKQVLEMLVEQGVIETSQIDEISTEIMQSGKSIAQVMVDFGIFQTEDELFQHLAAALGTDFVDISTFEPPPEVIRLVPAGHAILHRAFPLGLDGNTIQIVLGDPTNMQ